MGFGLLAGLLCGMMVFCFWTCYLIWEFLYPKRGVKDFSIMLLDLDSQLVTSPLSPD